MIPLGQLIALVNAIPEDQRNELLETLGGALKGTDEEKGIIDLALENSKQSLTAPTEKEIQENLKRYKVGKKEAIGHGLAKGLADISEIAGNTYGGYQSLLGEALLSMSHLADSPGYVNPLTAAVAPVVAGNAARGLVSQGLGKGVANTIRNIDSEIQKADDMNRNTELLIRENPNTGYYNLQRHRETVRERD